MSLPLFKKINQQLKSYTKELAYHIVGDPMVLSNLSAYLNISLQESLKVNLTTAGNTINKKDFLTLSHEAIKQVNFSINSYDANSHKKSLHEYLNPLFEFASYCMSEQKEMFVNFRLWNLDESFSAKTFNQKVFEYANAFFGSDLNLEMIYAQKPKSIKVGRKVFFAFDDYFQWPSLNNEYCLKEGFCYGLDSHFGVLSSGVVVPCCLDKDGIIHLGNVKTQSLEDILKTKKVKDIQQGFKNFTAVEALCQHCTYKTKFNTKAKEAHE
jgi:MoaA/NifB/PqqE/SkfB family radical SAM enzyme